MKKTFSKFISSVSSAAVLMTTFTAFPPATITVDAARSLDGAMFEQSSLVYNNDLAKICAEFSHTAENVDETNVLKLYNTYGFDAYEAYNYGDNAYYAYSFGYDEITVDGEDTALIFVTARGSTTTGDFLSDVEESTVSDWLNTWGIYDNTKTLATYSVYSNVKDFQYSIQTRLNQFINEECPDFYDMTNKKLVITGHSLGGAAANLTAANYDMFLDGGASWSEKLEQDDIYAYTFGAIKTKTESDTQTIAGFENIHNIYNYYDSFGPNGNLSAFGVSDPSKLFGHVDNVANVGNGEGVTPGHNMEAYKAALEAGGDICTLGYTAGLEFTEYDDYAAVSGCDKQAYRAIIPETYNGLPVTEISYSAFEDCYHLTKVYIPDSVTDIDNKAFYNCYNLKYFNFPENLENIGNYAFYGCSAISSISIPDTVTKIGKYAFYSTSLSEIKISSSLKSIDAYVFGNTNYIEYLEIPEGVTTIKEGAFMYTNIGTIVLPSTLKSIATMAFEYSYITNMTIPSSLKFIGSDAFYGGSSYYVKYLTIPDMSAWCEIEFENAYANPIVKAANVLQNNKLITEIIVPDGTTMISDYAFYNFDQLRGISIPDSVETIGNYAFYGCNNLTDVIIGNGTEYIGNSAFYGCDKMTGISIGSGVKEIGSYTFYDCDSLTYVTLPDGLTALGVSAFSECNNLLGVCLGSSIKTVPGSAFSDCVSLKEIAIPDTVGVIEYSAFYGCHSLVTMIITDSVYEIASQSIGYPYNTTSSSYAPYLRDESFTMYGYTGSIAERYAGENEINFVSLTPEVVVTVPVVPVTVTIPGGTTVTATTTTTTTTTTSTTSKTTTSTTSKTTTTTTTTNIVTDDTVYGDANCNSEVELSDAVIILQSLANSDRYGVNGTDKNHITEQGAINGDVYQNGTGLTAQDAGTIQRYVLKLVSSLPESYK